MRQDEARRILSVRGDATREEIRSAYLELAKRTHPDAASSVPGPAFRFSAVSEAYKTLTNPKVAPEIHESAARTRAYEASANANSYWFRNKKYRGYWAASKVLALVVIVATHESRLQQRRKRAASSKAEIDAAFLRQLNDMESQAKGTHQPVRT